MKYTIIIGEDERQLVVRVETAIKEGWKPLSGPYVNRSGYPCQAMTK